MDEQITLDSPSAMIEKAYFEAKECVYTIMRPLVIKFHLFEKVYNSVSYLVPYLPDLLK